MDSENNSAAMQTSKRKISPKAINIAKPSASEINELAHAFNQNVQPTSEELASSMTQRFPSHGFGWKVLGAIYQQQGLVEAALKALQLAAELLPQDSEAQYNLGNYFYDQLQLDAAVSCYQKAIKLTPRFAKAHYNLGSALKDQGLFADAAVSYKKALKIDPDNVPMNFNLALMLYEQEDFSGAIRHYQCGLKLQPDSAQAHVNLGVCFKALGDLVQAKIHYQQALSINPDYADAYNNLGAVFKELGDDVEAEGCYRSAIAIEPNYAAAYNNLGLLFKDQGDDVEAESYYLKALKIDPLRAVSYNNLATIYRDQGRLAESEACCRNAIKIKLDYGIAYNNLGLVLNSMGRFEEAEAEYEQALKYEPENITVLSNFAVTLNTLNQLSRAELLLKKALEILPTFVNALVNLCVNYLAQGRISEASALCLKALQIDAENIAVRNNLLFAMNYSASSNAVECLQQAREFGRIAALKATSPFNSWKFDRQAKRLRVGLVSGDLRLHSVAYFLENLLQHIDPARIELFAYSAAISEDYMTARLKPYFAGWKSLAGLDDQAAAALIHDDSLHILLDLSGHSSGNRLPVFAWKPAPVQVSWLGYFATTGLAAMDYFIADEVGVPIANQSQFVEKVKYLAETRLCFTAPDADISVAALPALVNGYITFGCFQNMAKVSDEVLDLWAEVMAKIPSARLRWQCKSFRDDAVVTLLRQRLVQRGIHADRICLVKSTLRDAYLMAHAEVDLMLDTFPFTGGTTTCEALWMGVPTLTLAGNTLIARQGASLLSAAGLADWVADSKATYVSKALLLTNDLDKLSSLRAGLRAQVLASPLFDAPRFARNMEELLWEMWHESQGTQSKFAASAGAVVAADAIYTIAADLKSKLKIKVVTATKLTETDFWSKAALGLSLKRHLKMDASLSVEVAYSNARGLSEIFNQAIARADEDEILVFMHDDVWIDEANFVDAVIAGLEHYDVIGVAGNQRRLANQPAWAFVDAEFTWDDQSHLSGSIAHGQNAFSKQEVFGEMPATCELLDGVFMASKTSSLKRNQVQFDPQFDFHFYDMDFCRSARKAGLKLGTWPIKLTHQSGGAFGSRQWRAKYQLYKNKWESDAIPNNLTSPHGALTERELNLQQAMDEVLQMAVQHQNTGRIEQAVSLYLEIISIEPDHAAANHNLGVIEASLRGAVAALPRLALAVQTQPDNEQFWVSYIDALVQAGHTDSVADALELGSQYGLSSESARILSAELEIAHESKVTLTQDKNNHNPFGIHIHQIYYSEQTQRENDPGFIGLNNLANERPDWREYWPVRNYLLNTTLNENDYYGFFSPKFKAKTNLDATVVHEFISEHGGEADVLLFSPFFDQGAFYLNIFEQGAKAHKGITEAFQGGVALISPEVDLATLVMDSRNIVFCNYFVAKPAFWKLWLECCELLFTAAEENKTTLATSLNANSRHDGSFAPNKVFVIERIASLLLSTQKNWKVKAYNQTLLPNGNASIAKYTDELLQMDALKIASTSQGDLDSLGVYFQIQQQVHTDIKKKKSIKTESAVNEVLQLALQHQSVGRIEQAQSLYLEILNIEPSHAEANHNLGVIEAQLKGASAALPRLELAVQTQPENEQYWVSYIDALMQSGATDTAASAIEIGLKYGLRSETAQMLAAEFVDKLESAVVLNPNLVQTLSISEESGLREDSSQLQPWNAFSADGIKSKIATQRRHEAQPLVSIIIVTHRPNHFKNALACALSQTYSNKEIIVSDNSETDEIYNLCMKYSEVSYRKNLNGMPASNIAQPLSMAKGKYIKYIFDDDLVYPNCIDTMMGCLNQLSENEIENVGVITSSRHLIDEGSICFGEIRLSNVSEPTLLTGKQIVKEILCEQNNFIGEFSTIMFKLDLINYKDPESIFKIFGAEFRLGLIDVPLYVSVLMSSNLLYIPYSLSAFRKHSDGGSNIQNNPNLHYAVSDWIKLALLGFHEGVLDHAEAKLAVSNYLRLSANYNHYFPDQLSPWNAIAEDFIK